jgi:hypothetical protein
MIISQKEKGIYITRQAGLNGWPNRTHIITQMRRAGSRDASEDARIHLI